MAPRAPPEGINTSWYEYSFDTFETDEGVVGYTMQNANLRGRRRRWETSSTTVYAPQLIGENPIASEALWHKLRRLNRHAYNLSDGVAGVHRRGGLGHPRQGREAADRLDARTGAREGPGLRHRAQHRADARGRFQGGRERKSQGYHGFKIQFWDGLDRDIPRFRAAREAVGDGYPLMQDAAGMYTYTQALAAGKVLGELGYEWFEEPIPDRNLFQLQRLTDQLDVPILAGETSRVHELAEMIRMGACDIARGDVHMKEGITGLHKAAGMADLLGFELEVHGINQPLLEPPTSTLRCR